MSMCPASGRRRRGAPSRGAVHSRFPLARVFIAHRWGYRLLRLAHDRTLALGVLGIISRWCESRRRRLVGVPRATGGSEEWESCSNPTSPLRSSRVGLELHVAQRRFASRSRSCATKVKIIRYATCGRPRKPLQLFSSSESSCRTPSRRSSRHDHPHARFQSGPAPLPDLAERPTQPTARSDRRRDRGRAVPTARHGIKKVDATHVKIKHELVDRILTTHGRLRSARV